jgi:hypothetical protein
MITGRSGEDDRRLSKKRVAMLDVPPAEIARRYYDVASPALPATSATTSL